MIIVVCRANGKGQHVYLLYIEWINVFFESIFVLLYCLSSPTGIAFVPPKTTGDILDTLAIPVTVLVCTGYNHYRKPSVLIWEYFEQHCNGDKRIDLKSVSLSLSGCLQP